MPSGKRTRCDATSLPASRYFVTSAGDITSACPVFVNPSPAAPSTGNSRAGFSDSIPVRSRSVYVYSAFDNRLSTTRPGSPPRAAPTPSRPHRRLPFHPVRQRDGLQVEIALVLLTRMAREAELAQQRPDHRAEILRATH